MTTNRGAAPRRAGMATRVTAARDPKRRSYGQSARIVGDLVREVAEARDWTFDKTARNLILLGLTHQTELTTMKELLAKLGRNL